MSPGDGMRMQPGSWGGGGWSKPLLHPRSSCASQCVLATSAWGRVLASCEQDSEVSRGQRAGGIGALGLAILAQTVQTRPTRTRALRTTQQPGWAPPSTTTTV